MLSFEQIKELIEMVAKHRLHGLESDGRGKERRARGGQ